MEQKKLELSKRMKALVDMVSSGNIVCDVGCDHGFVSIYLVQNKICPRAIAMDVRSGPLSRAKMNIDMFSLNEYIETRLSNGLEEIKPGEAQTCICAGMGGKLMMQILMEGKDKLITLKELVLQPQSDISIFRRFLREEGFQIVDEDMVVEEGKYYPIMKAVYQGETNNTSEIDVIYDEFGEILLKKKHLVLKEYLNFVQKNLMSIQMQLQQHASEKSEMRLQEIQTELELVTKALGYWI